MPIHRWIIFSAAAILFGAGFTAAQDGLRAEKPSSGPPGPYLGEVPPGNTPVLFAPGLISTGREHSAAMFTPDGTEVWFGRIFPAKLYYSRIIEDEWTEPQEAPFCDSYNCLYPVLAPGGDKIFFTSDRPENTGGGRLGRGNGRIWTVDRRPGGWSAPRLVESEVNFGTRQSCGSITADGSMYFSAKENKTPPDLYFSKLVDGAYTPAVKLESISSPVPEHCPLIGPEERYLIFSSFRGGYGRSDLYVCFRSPDGGWSEPKNMGPVVNSAYKDEYPYVTPDGKYLFFNSNRPSDLNSKPIPDGPGNIYWVSTQIIEDLE